MVVGFFFITPSAQFHTVMILILGSLVRCFSVSLLFHLSAMGPLTSCQISRNVCPVSSVTVTCWSSTSLMTPPFFFFFFKCCHSLLLVLKYYNSSWLSPRHSLLLYTYILGPYIPRLTHQLLISSPDQTHMSSRHTSSLCPQGFFLNILRASRAQRVRGNKIQPHLRRQERSAVLSQFACAFESKTSFLETAYHLIF